MAEERVFDQGLGGGINRFGKNVVDFDYKSPWGLDQSRQVNSRIVAELESYTLEPKPGKNDQRERYELASLVASMPQMAHANMKLVAGTLYIISSMDTDGGFINAIAGKGEKTLGDIADQYFDSVYKHFGTIDEQPDTSQLRLAFKANLIRYLSAFYNWIVQHEIMGDEEMNAMYEDFLSDEGYDELDFEDADDNKRLDEIIGSGDDDNELEGIGGLLSENDNDKM